MRSKHVDDYNHDEYADEYDADVAQEDNPIRAGYDALLDWVIQSAGIGESSRLLELGSGTGNLTARIPVCGELVCVDISQRMEEIAQPKLAHLTQRRFIADDLLQVFERPQGEFDAVISTYAVHHLTREEKRQLFERVWASLLPGGRAAFGDLMLENAAQGTVKAAQYRAAGQDEVAESIEEEFFWLLDACVADLEEIGFCCDGEALLGAIVWSTGGEKIMVKIMEISAMVSLVIGTTGLLANMFFLDWGRTATLVFAFFNISGLIDLGRVVVAEEQGG